MDDTGRPPHELDLLVPGFVLGGVGAGLLNPALASTAIGTVRREMAGIGSGANNTCRQIGIAVGIAGLGAIFQSKVHDEVVTNLTRQSPGLASRAGSIADAVSQGGGPGAVHASPQVSRTIAQVSEAAFVSGLDRILWVGAVGALIGAVLTAILIRPQDFQPWSPEAARPDAAEPAPIGTP